VTHEPPVDLHRARRRKAEMADPSRVDRLPPHSVEAEQGVLGCILLSPQECLGDCITRFRAGPDVFYDLRHRTLYETMVEMFDRKEAVDTITLSQTLKDRGQLESAGGRPYLASMPDAVPSAANLNYYVEIVREKHLLRRMISACTEVVGRAYEHQGEVDALLDQVERDILKIGQERVTGRDADIKTLVAGAIDQIEKFHQNQGALSGLGTGFPDFDRMTRGLHPGEMIVIAARPGLGKTSLAMNIAEAVAIEQKRPVGVFSLEMTAESLVLRMLCSRARVNLRDVTGGFLAERDFPRLAAASAALGKAPLFIDDTPGLSILQLRAKARRMHQQHGIALFVIDYLQLLHSDNRKAENRQQEIADISGGAKALAKELGVPVIALAQLNREIEKRERGAKPRLADLRESGAIEQDADLVGLLYLNAPDGSAVEEALNSAADALPVNLLIAKQRNGPTGDVALTFLKPYTRFESAAKVGAEDVPR
jgi:replicative DNA helicase